MDLKELFKKKPEHCYDAHPTILGKVWHFLAHEDSFASLLADILLILLISKFIILPAAGFILGTKFPFVVVVSSSMDHHGQDFESWWEENKDWYLERNITKEMFESFPYKDGFKKGDIFVVKSGNISMGDVIVYTIPGQPEPIIHRVVNISDGVYTTKGDANYAQLGFEKAVFKEQISGKTILRIPYLGWVKVGFVELLNKVKSMQ